VWGLFPNEGGCVSIRDVFLTLDVYFLVFKQLNRQQYDGRMMFYEALMAKCKNKMQLSTKDLSMMY